jgi:diguanylate cyclase (GGDEF)-like protein/PAS domain S-box-containing protein
VLRWLSVGDADTPTARALLNEQFRILTRQVPVAYLFLLVESASVSWMLPAELPWLVRFGTLGVFAVVVGMRVRRWRALQSAAPSAEQILALFRRTRQVASAVNLACAAWGLVLFNYLDAQPRAIIAMFTCMCAIGVACCLGSLPALARLTAVLAALPIIVRLLFCGDPLLSCIGINLLLVLLLFLRMLDTQYFGFVRLTGSRTRMSAARERARNAEAAAERAEREARAAHATLMAAVDAIPEGFAIYDAEDRHVLWNTRYAELWAACSDVLRVGLRFEDMLRIALDRGRFPEAIGCESEWLADQLRERARPRSSIEQRLRDDRWLRVEHRRTDDGGSIGICIDITDLKRREASFRLLFDENPLPMWVADLETLKFLAVNAATSRHYGYSRDELLASTIDCLRVPEERAAMRAEFATLRGIQSAAFVRRHVKADGSRIDVAIDSRPLRYDGRDACVAVAFDVTERKRAEEELTKTRELLNAVIESVPAPILVKDAVQRRYVLANRAAERFLGIARDAVIGRTASELFPQAMAQRIEEYDSELVETDESRFHEDLPLETPGNGLRSLNASSMTIRALDGSPQYIMRVLEDITDRKEAQQRIIHMARHDALTDLPNRVALDEQFARMLDHARTEGGSFAVLCIDLDRFKEINDLFGHSVGDTVLRVVSRRLRSAAQDALVVRLGGDEFVVIASQGAQPTDTRALAERLHASMQDDIIADGHALRLALSIGIAIYPNDGTDPTTLIRNADAALYRAKHEGRGDTRFFTAAMDRQLRERRALQHDLRSAIERDELSLDYQPQAQTLGGTTGMEALIRWRHPSRGPVPPSEFIPIAEDSGLIGAIGEWVLRAACREAACWGNPLRIAVNVSAVQFRRGDLTSLVHSVLIETRLPPDRLELEITEGVLIENISRTASILRSLKALGVRIAIDDFGTGYSSLSYLQSFPLDRLKIDRSFIANLGRNHGALAIVRGVIGLAHGLTLPVLAEGVETEEQRAILAQEGCDEVQGYLIGRPRGIETYAPLIKRAVDPPARLARARL